MSVPSQSGFYLPDGDLIEVSRRGDTECGYCQTALVTHMASQYRTKKLRCACSTEECPRWLIPFHTSRVSAIRKTLIGLRRESINDGHPVDCPFQREFDDREELCREDYAGGANSFVERQRAVTRLGGVSLINAARCYTRLWSRAWSATRTSKIRPEHFLQEFSGEMSATLLPGGTKLSVFLAGANLRISVGLVHKLPKITGLTSGESPELLPAVIWQSGGLASFPLAVEGWLLERAKMSVSVLGKLIPGPYLMVAVESQGRVTNLWLKPVYLAGDNFAIVDSGCERRFCGHLDRRKQTWFKPPTSRSMAELPPELWFWNFHQSTNRFDFAVFSGPERIYVVETTTFELASHPDYERMASARLTAFGSMRAQNGFKIRVLSRSPGEPQSEDSHGEPPQIQGSVPDMSRVAESLFVLLGDGRFGTSQDPKPTCYNE